MRAKKKDLPYLLCLLVMPALGFIYTLLNTDTREAVILSTQLDEWIPFVPIFIVPYILWYAFILGYLFYFWYKDVPTFLKTLGIIFIGELVCFVIYFYFQTTVPRPELAGSGVFLDMVQMIYSHDQPYNAFPSIHVLTTFAIILGNFNIQDKHRFHSVFVPAMGSLIIVSTLFVKQHFVLDMVSSIFLTTFIYGIMFELYGVSAKKSKQAYLED
ncbi:phosphatase PAP2 family protein [Rossellomorea vietnamensis]|uniref:Phosphatase PAP2 family protein n=1 Tax=Rossellomorea vietnamensis TaxID=218284 RepID=A0ACD4C5Z8_9BACI|nr:phosphatase PAP2 family protein [Rossellomorea vietnamensis]UXH43862.1 phosphatase PAP2 family protein [Rossellomorea vietnamensis]